MAGWFLYILECGDGSFYVGITNDLGRRLMMHNAGKASKYTRARLPVHYRYTEAHPTRSSASIREAEIKRWPRGRKAGLGG